MKRVFSFLFGLLLLIFLIYYAATLAPYERIKTWLEQVQSFNEFTLIHYIVLAVLLIISIFLILWAFRPSDKRHKLAWATTNGELVISRKAIDSYIEKTVNQFENVRIVSIDTTLKERNNKRTIDSVVKVLWAPSDDVPEYSVEDINSKIQSKLEEFTNANVENVKLIVTDQEKTEKRVI